VACSCRFETKFVTGGAISIHSDLSSNAPPSLTRDSQTGAAAAVILQGPLTPAVGGLRPHASDDVQRGPKEATSTTTLRTPRRTPGRQYQAEKREGCPASAQRRLSGRPFREDCHPPKPYGYRRCGRGCRPGGGKPTNALRTGRRQVVSGPRPLFLPIGWH
jgi:hypothetical protein